MKTFLSTHKQALLALLAAIASGIFTALLFDPFNEFGALWMAFVPLLLIIRTTPTKTAFWAGWLCGCIAWGIQLHWLYRLTETGGVPAVVLIGYGLLTLYMGLYTGLFALIASLLRNHLLGATPNTPGPKRILTCVLFEPLLWVALEIVRAHLFTGFAWNPLGLAFTMNLPVFQLAAIGGVSLVSALIIALNGALTSLIERLWWSLRRQLPERAIARLLLSLETCLPFLLFLFAFLWGAQRIKTYDARLKNDPQSLNILVQTTELPSLTLPKTDFVTSALRDARFIDLLSRGKTYHLWLTPESSFLHNDLSDIATPQGTAMGHLRESLETISALTAPLLIGGTYTTDRLENPRFYNASLLITQSPFDPTQHLYRKRHLVPFGEYIPFDKTFTALQNLVPTGISCSAGDETTMTLPSGHRFGPLICFDDCDAALSRASVIDGAQFLVNTSNDAWFMPSSEPLGHLRQAIARSVETGVPMIRTSNRGGASAIDAVGRIAYVHNHPTKVKNYMLSATPFAPLCQNQEDQTAIYTYTLPLTAAPFAATYLTYGEAIFALPCLLLTLGFLFWCLFKRYTRKRPLAVSALLLLVFALPRSATASSVSIDTISYQLLPAAAMAIDDNNTSLAEETANRILSELGLTPERRAQAEEILIRSDLKNKAYDDVLERIDRCPELAAERRLVFLMLAHLGKQDYDLVNQRYEELTLEPTSDWGLSALRIALIADLEQDNKLRAAERFNLVHKHTATKPAIRAANALAWNQTFPSPAARDALLQMAENSEKGGLFFECAEQLPVAFKNITADRPFNTLKKVIASPTIDPLMKARLSIITAQLAPTFNEKIAFAKSAIETASPEDKRHACLVLGDAYLVEGSQKEIGLDYLKKAIIMDPSADEAPYTQLRIAETYMEMGQTDLALKEYDRYRQSYALPALAVRHLQGYGRALLQNNNPLDAIETFIKAIDYVGEDDAKKMELLSEASNAAALAQDYDRAIDFLEQRLAIDVQNRPAITLAIAQLYEKKNDLPNATERYSSICTMTHVDGDIHAIATLRLGAIHMDAGRTEEAITRYATSMTRLPDGSPAKAQIQLARGKAYYTIADYDKAYLDFEQTKNAQDPAIANEAHFFLVLCLYRLGRDEEAHLLADEYIASSPDNHRVPDILLWLAKSDFNNGNYTEARKGFATFLERWPQDPRTAQILYLEALSSYFEQRYLETLQSLARLAKDYPTAPILPDARFLQAQTLIQHARHGEARDLLLDLIAHHPQATWIGEAYGLLGDCHSLTAANEPSRLEAALKAYRSAILCLDEIDADNALCYRYKMGRIYEKQNYRPDAAKEYYRLIYTLLSQPQKYTKNGILWAKRALVRLNDIETAAGHGDKLKNLHDRLREANIPNLMP